MGIGLMGLASGLDTGAILEQLMALERRPIAKVQLTQRQVEVRQAALRDISSKLGALKSAALDLRSVATWADTQTVESSDTTKLGATLLSSAAAGGYQVEVTRMARAEQRAYAYTASTSATQIDVGGVLFDIAAGADLKTVVSTINARSDSPVSAAEVSGQLVLSAKKTGAASTFTATGATIAEDATKAKLGVDAEYKVDGVVKTSATNIVKDGIAGLELALKGVTASAVTVTVGAPAPDEAKIKEKVKAFVEKYNAMVDLVYQKVDERRVVKPKTEAEALKGTLAGDSMLIRTLSSLRSGVSELVAGNPGAMDELREIGISTGATTGSGTVSGDAIKGKLVVDEAKLSSALSSDRASVRSLLDGFSKRLEGLIDPITTAGGTIPSRLNGGDAEIKRLRDSAAAMEQRLQGRERILRAQFDAMERALAASRSQGAWLAGQLGSLQR